jgi:NADH:ubiquinone oxidoreductase subunit 5 (subunit L)/multisubunit Na+/H+ antiporter MnhA subunit
MPGDPVLVAWCVLAPCLGAFLLPALGAVSERIRNAVALLLVLVSFACAAALLPGVWEGRSADLTVAGIDVLHADRLAVLMALVSSGVGSIIVLYSWGYIAGYGSRNEYYLMVVLFLGAMMGLVFARHLLVLYGFWEITALACWRLIGFFRDPLCVRRADKAFLVTVFGAVVMLLGFLSVYADAGTFDLGALTGRPISNLATGLILVGILSKSATLPLHTWLPDAGVAPSPVTALLHAAVLVKIGVYVFARLFLATFTVEAVWHQVVPWIAAASALVSAGAALVDTDMKRIIAYSTVSQLAFILLGLSAGGDLAAGGGLLYIVMHSIAKGGLFLCAGVVEHETHCKDITKLGGLIRTMPVTAVCFAACALSVMGIPPFGGFFAKVLVITGAFGSGQTALALTFVLGSVLTVLYLLRIFSAIFLGEPRGEAAVHAAREGTRGMVASVALLATLALASGLFVKYPTDLVRSTVEQMTRAAP